MRSTKSVARSTADTFQIPDSDKKIFQWLEDHFRLYNTSSFIEDDPVSVPHRFSRLQDIEIAGFFTAIMAWGNRTTIIRKSLDLMQRMDDAPYDFIRHHQEKDRKRFATFRHRTLQPEDVIFLVDRLQQYYSAHDSLEQAFINHMGKKDKDVYHGLAGFHDMLFQPPWVLERTRKHIATPVRKSSCKRLNMFLRWMVRKDTAGVDFGVWKKIKPSQLIIPLDVHVGAVARHLHLMDRKANDWRAAKELTDRLKSFDPNDPVKYDYALFGAGVNRAGR